MTFSLTVIASTNSLFAPGAFDSCVGRNIRINVDGASTNDFRIIKAKVTPNGLAVVLTVTDEPQE